MNRKTFLQKRINEGFKNTSTDGMITYAKEKPAFDYTMSGKSEQKLLPDEYQQVEYIESTGTQYIDTGVNVGGLLRTVCNIGVDNTVSQDCVLFGGRITVSSENYSFRFNSTQTDFILRSDYNYVAGTELNIPKTNYNFIIDKNKNSTTITGNNGYSYTDLRIAQSSFTSSRKFIIFGYDNNGTISSFSKMKLYYFKIYNNDVLIRDFIPCYRKSDNEIGLYDTVNNIFYTNQGTGTFLKGADAPTPEQPIEIKSVGNLVTSGEHQGKYEIRVKIKGKNDLKDINNWIYKTYYKTTKDIVDNKLSVTSTESGNQYASVSYNNYNCVSGKTYTISMKSIASTTNTPNFRLGKNNNDIPNIISMGTSINKGTYYEISSTFTADSDFELNVSFYPDYRASAVISNAVFYDFMIKETSIGDDTYEPYHEPVTVPIYLDEPLRSIGDSRDKINFITKKRMNKTGKDIFDGDENLFTLNTLNNESTMWFEMNTALQNAKEQNAINSTRLLSNYFSVYNCYHSSNTTNGICYHSDKKVQFRILRSLLNEQTVNDFKTWLSQHPTEVQYELATPTEETISLPQLPLHKGTNIITIGTEVQPYSTEIIYKSSVKE